MSHVFRFSGICALLMAGTCAAAEAPSCQQVRMGVANWTDVMATSAVAKVLLDELGYKTEQTFASEQIVLTAIKDKKLDLFLGYWAPLMTAAVEPMVAAKQIAVSAKPNLTGANATLAVPRYLFEQGLKTFADIPRFKEALGGKIHGIESGSATNQQIQAMIDKNQFGLGDFKLVESSEAGMLAQVRRAETRKTAIVFFGWTPHPMNVSMDMDYLTGSEDALGPDEGAATVWTVTQPDYAQRCPNVQKLLTQLTFTTAGESQMMVAILAGQQPDAVARQWLKDHPEDRRRWTDGVQNFNAKLAQQ
ncbi:choline ABC transporter substrate-binding protein [Pseudomonas sp. SZMC_28357]|uniref:choline ABC transporter substrate-binding protein n=1 Tax=Pseudomonas sp. SZMC_28357 TaxID=3074380 RepID=UPI0028711C18|nr:choline ABC transporter substrate-binding protein [Pseudomonas sp. SZMC_28357]MDR9749916.1 choline ABC transporter substrate-binding protein [Pseudomonas sp. SZMC_28357]